MSADTELLKAFLANRDLLFAFILALTGDPDASEEIFQEVGLAIAEESGKGTVAAPFLPWACEVARRRVSEYYRKSARRRTVERPLGSLEQAVAQSFVEYESTPGPNRLRHEHLLKCLEMLRGRKKDVIKGHYRDRRSVRQIAAALSSTEGAVKVALWKARQGLARCVEGRMRLQLEGE